MAERRCLSEKITTAKSAALSNAPASERIIATTPAVTIAALPPPKPPSDSKQARLVGLLHRAEGATIAELMAATGWMSHSVRGALSAVVKRKFGLVVDSQLETDRGRVYRIAAPTPAKRTRRSKLKESAAAAAPAGTAAA